LHGALLVELRLTTGQSKRIKNLADIARLVEAHPHLWDSLTHDLRQQIQRPEGS
jgi:hypothetical protein